METRLICCGLANAGAKQALEYVSIQHVVTLSGTLEAKMGSSACKNGWQLLKFGDFAPL
jgi:hypothetical protein